MCIRDSWYSLRDVARVLGLSRQAVHTRVRKGQLEADLIDGVWQVPGAVAAAVQTQRKRALSLGSVRLGVALRKLAPTDK